MKPEDLIAQIDETLSEARGETVEMTPAQFLAFVTAHTKRMDSDSADAVLKRANYLIEILGHVAKYESRETVAIPLLTGPESVQAQTAYKEFGERSVALVTGAPRHAFMEKAEKIKATLVAFVKANTPDGETAEEEPEAAAEDTSKDESGEPTDDGKEPAKKAAEADDVWPLNFNAKEDDSKADDFFGPDPKA